MASRINLRDPTDIASILFLLTIFVNGFFGIFYSIQGTLEPFYEEFIGKTTPVQITAGRSVAVIVGSIGFYEIAMAITQLFILKYGFRQKEKWAWYAFLIPVLVWWIPYLIIAYSIVGLFGSAFFATLFGIVIQIIALAISYRDFFTKS